MGLFIRHEACEKCDSSDGKAVYDDGSSHCFVCGYTEVSEEYLQSKQDKRTQKSTKEKDYHMLPAPSKKPNITVEEVKEIVENTSSTGRGFRGISDDTYSKFGVRHEFDEVTGEVTKQYYPVTKQLERAGYKIRGVPKMFYSKGNTGQDCDLFMQRNFQTNGKWLILCEGEIDALSAYQMLKDYYAKRGNDYDVAAVSGTVGAKSTRQIAAQYKFFDSFSNIVLCYDNDEAGQDSIEDVVKALPKGKVKIMKMTYKDPNDYLINNQQGLFVKHFFDAETYVPEGVVGSSQLYEKLLKHATVEKVQFPPFMKKLDNMLGSIELGTIGIFAAGTGAAKCLGKDTPILMFDQSVKMVQDVVNGDKIMGPDGTPRTVTGVVSGQDNMYSVKQVKGITYTVNSKHILSLRANRDIKYLNLKKNDVYNVNIQDYLNLTPNNKHFLKGWKGEFKNLDNGFSDKEAYIYGLWLAEGTTKKPQFTLANKDKELFDELYSFCQRNNYRTNICPSNYRENCTSVDLAGGFAKTLVEFGYGDSKKIPSKYLNASRQTRLDLLAGFLDGDGFLDSNGYSMTLKITQLSDDIITLARSLGFAVNARKTFKKCQDFDGTWYQYIGINGFTEEIPNRLKRKKAGPRAQIKNPLNTGIEVTSVGVGEYYGFELDGDRLFCLGDGTVTHNTTVANELLYYWIFNSPHKIGVVSLELTCEQYAQVLLSRHISKKISLIKDNEEKLAFLRTDYVKSKAVEIFSNEYGNDRFMVIDEREGSLEIMQSQIEQLIISCGCKVIILDPVSDMLEGLPNEQQALFMKWCKSIIKTYNVHILMIAHIRKSQNNKDSASTGAAIPDDSIFGSGSLMKSASWIVMLQRDKTNEDAIVRNTTRLTCTKNRSGGETGPAGDLYYDNTTHTLHDKEEFMLESPKEL